MSDQQRLSVSYGSFSCDIVGFQDPLPVLQDVIGEFRQIAWRYPGFGAQKDFAQRDRLSRLVASKLNAALSGRGVSVTQNSDNGGLLVQPVGGAEEGEGWGDLFAKPKPGEKPQGGTAKHPAAPRAEATAAPGAAAFAAVETPPEAPAAKPRLEIVAETPAPDAEPEVAEAEKAPTSPVAEEAAAEVKEAPIAAEDAEAPVAVEATAVEATTIADAPAAAKPEAPVEVAPPEPKAAAEPGKTSEPIAEAKTPEPSAEAGSPDATAAKETSAPVEIEDAAPADTVKTPEPAAEPATPTASPEAEVAKSKLTTPVEPDARPAQSEAPEPDAAPDLDVAIAAQVRDEVKAVVNTEIKDAFQEMKDAEKPVGKPITAGFARSDEGSSRGGLFSRLLGGKKGASNPEAASDTLHLAKAEPAEAPKKSEESKAGIASDDAALEEAFQSIARQLKDDKPADKDIAEDLVFSSNKPAKPADDEALLLSTDKALPPEEAADALAAEERVARAKAKVMERAKERQAAEAAANERRLRIIRREHVEEKSDEMKGAVAKAAAGAPAMSAQEFAKLAGAASLQELMEASAAYATLVGGKHKFTRSDLMEVMHELDKKNAYSHEALIKSFGKMLRTGVLLRVDDGLFAMSVNHRHPYETKIHA